MADVEVVAASSALPADSNGGLADADGAAEVQLALDAAPGGEAKAGVEAAPEPERQRAIYFVRVPRPQLSDGSITKLDAELSACFTKLKALNSKSQVKRGEANELRTQLGLARSLRNGSSPEFDEKMTRLRQLRDMRKGYLDKISDLKAGRAGLECRTEEELDEKLAEMEHSIQHDGLPLAVEKDMVRKISKLKAQREKIREFQGAQEGLGQLEAEAKKLKAVIDEVDSEVNILRGERDQAKDIIDDLSKKLAAVNAVLDEYQAERQEVEGTKRELQEQLKVLRDENDAAMLEYRANRKLSLTLRELVADGKVDEAAAAAEEQVESYLTKLSSDKAYRKEYIKLWSEQRRYLVSELLPQSGNLDGAVGGAAGGKGGKPGAKGGAGKPAAPLVPQGAAKAQAIIAAALQEADATIAAKRLEQPAPPQQAPQHSDEASDEAEEAEPEPQPPARRVVPGASDELIAAPKPKAHKAASSFTRPVTEVLEIPDYEYIIPASKKADTQQQLSADELKAKVREEQRQKAQEAELRKRRRQEQASKKAAAKQKAAAEAAAAIRAGGSRVAQLAAEDTDGAASGTDNERDEPAAAEPAVAAATVAAAAAGGGGGHGKGKGGKAKQHGGQAAAPKKLVKKPAKAVKWHQQYAVQLASAGVALLLLLLVFFALTTK